MTGELGLPSPAGRCGVSGSAGALSWRVHIPAVGETWIRVRCREAAGTGPWPLSRALAELGRMGLRPVDRFRSLGAGRGQPLIHSQEAEWRGLAAHLESTVTVGGAVVEAALSLPGMDEIVPSVGEDDWWDLVDVFAAAVGAGHGALGDGEPLAPRMPADRAGWRHRIGDHIGLLVPEETGTDWSPLAGAYTPLPTSRLWVLLR